MSNRARQKNKREQIGRWNQMTVLRFQIEGWGGGGGGGGLCCINCATSASYVTVTPSKTECKMAAQSILSPLCSVHVLVHVQVWVHIPGDPRSVQLQLQQQRYSTSKKAKHAVLTRCRCARPPCVLYARTRMITCARQKSCSPCQSSVDYGNTTRPSMHGKIIAELALRTT